MSVQYTSWWNKNSPISLAIANHKQVLKHILVLQILGKQVFSVVGAAMSFSSPTPRKRGQPEPSSSKPKPPNQPSPSNSSKPKSRRIVKKPSCVVMEFSRLVIVTLLSYCLKIQSCTNLILFALFIVNKALYSWQERLR